ncbi:MAG: hypothetical protein GXX91_13180 [Verrucomicrobiaceae bacterium]|nr:hypothetical protein [Verrucomicrobiaceae bacterium]
MLLGSRLFEDASPEIGKFRNYLLGALRNFVAKEVRAQRAVKRGGGREALSLDFCNAEDYLRAEHYDEESPDLAFDRQWAWDLLELTMSRLEKHYRDRGKGGFFDAMKGRLFGERDDRTIAEIAGRLGMEAGAAKVGFHRMKRRYSRTLKDEVARTLGDASGVEEELRYLISLFAKR